MLDVHRDSEEGIFKVNICNPQILFYCFEYIW